MRQEDEITISQILELLASLEAKTDTGKIVINLVRDLLKLWLLKDGKEV